MADDNLRAAATVWAAGDSDSFGMAMVLFFIATNLLAHLVLGYGLWRAKIVPWWAAVCLPALPILVLDPGSSPWWGTPFLILLLPFTIAAGRLLSDDSVASDVNQQSLEHNHILVAAWVRFVGRCDAGDREPASFRPTVTRVDALTCRAPVGSSHAPPLGKTGWSVLG